MNADAIRQWLVADGYDDRRIVVIRNGIDLAPFSGSTGGRLRQEFGLSADVPIIGCIARLSGVKGIEHLVRAVVFTGYRADVPAILPDFDVVVSASLDEGLSNAILEAMAAGVPVVATRVGRSPEAVVDGETGRLVPPADPNAIARAIADVLVAPGAARRMGSVGRERVRQCFSLDAMVARTAALHEELRTTSPRRRAMRSRPADPRRPNSWTRRDQHFS